MAQQKGSKRAAKLLVRKRKTNAQAKLARARRAIRQVELAEKEGSKEE